MRLRQSSGVDLAGERMVEELQSSGPGCAGQEMDRKYWMALALYGVLALLVWFTMDAGKVLVFGRAVEFRLVPLIVIGGLALRTVVAHQAARVRRSGDENGS